MAIKAAFGCYWMSDKSGKLAIELTQGEETCSGKCRHLTFVSWKPIRVIGSLTVPATASQSSQPGLR